MGALRYLRFVLIASIAFVIGIPLVIFLVIFFVIVMVAQFPGSLWKNHKWKSELKRRGRFRNRSLDTEAIKGGTLIVDSPTLGWRLEQCWWTPDNIRAICPHTVPIKDDRERHVRSGARKLEMPFDVWCYERYIDPDNGTAILLAARRGDRYAKRIAEKVRTIDRVDSWSAPVVMATKDSGPDESTTDHADEPQGSNGADLIE